jgi:hypothetical protein
MNALPQYVGTKPCPAAAYRQLMMQGLEPAEAANIAAVLAGLPIATPPWTVREVDHFLFLRARCEDGRFGPEDGAG